MIESIYWGLKEPISKPVFVDLLAKVWHKGLSPANVVSTFRTTGIWLVDKNKYPIDRLDQRLMKRYNYWNKLGRPDELYDDFATSVSTPKKVKEISASSQDPVASVSSQDLVASVSSNDPVSSTPVIEKTSESFPAGQCSSAQQSDFDGCKCEVCVYLGPKPTVNVPGKTWVAAWTLLDAPSNKSFEEMILDKMKGKQEKVVKTRRKIDQKAKVITDPEYLKDLLEKEALKKTNKKIDFLKGTGKKEKVIDMSSESETDEDIMSETDEEEIEDDNDEEEMINTWKALNLPNKEENVVQKWYACIYETKKKNHLYIGKAVKRFLDDKEGPVNGLEIECLKPHVGTGNVLESVPEHLERDVDVFPAYCIIDGPLHVIPLKGGKWEISEYTNLKEKFERVEKMDRKTIYSCEL